MIETLQNIGLGKVLFAVGMIMQFCGGIVMVVGVSLWKMK